MTATPADTAVEIRVNPSRPLDDAVIVTAGRRGTGAYVHIKFVGQRGGARVEQIVMTDAMRRQLIAALGGAPG